MHNYFFLLLCMWCSIINMQGQVTLSNPQTDQKLLKHFQDGKLGLFVHWMACHTPETGDSWSIGGHTPKSVSDSITMEWNPAKFNAKAMVDIATKAGCKYMVVISKHHDGFSIWDSKYSIFDIERIPFKRDILKELGDECRRQGLLYGIYYSIADIDYCGWSSMAQAGKPIQKPKYGEKDFIRFVHNQVKELIENYNPDLLWFDGFWLDSLWSSPEGKELYQFIKSRKWNTLSTRLAAAKDDRGKETFITDGSSGDFYSLEAKTTDAPNFPWEACTSITYPIYAYEPDAKMLTKKELIEMFSKTLCGNGNLLVNIGPKPTGEMPEEQVNRFYELTDWIKLNEAAVYNTQGGPFKQGDWGGSTYKQNMLYIHLRKNTDILKINTLYGYRIKSSIDLASKKKLRIKQSGNEITIYLPHFTNEREIPVIALELDKEYIFTEWISLYKSK